MKQTLLFPVLVLTLSGCDALRSQGEERPGPLTGPSQAAAATEFAPTVATTALGARAVSAAALDTTTEAEKAAALATPATGGEKSLGKTVVALGPPAEQGLWLSTSLVTKVTQGRIETAAGQSLTLELRPGTGGSLLSLAAYQALGLPLTGLPEISVYAN
ncbi:MAG: D-galactarate dehydratase [Tabrizicola sp.]|jgi:hypothetical protein|nr:D-galactarate dehydratase [Tabrizicola sp.]